MKIIISPAKKMNVNTDAITHTTTPIHMNKTAFILETLKSLSYDELKSIWRCNNKIATENFDRISSMKLDVSLTPALLAYDGIQYKYMASGIFEDNLLSYANEHLRILSGFYGVLRPLDGITPYRLDMQADLSINGYSSLYDFWGDSLYHDIATSGIILNLASKEYSKCIEKYLRPSAIMVTCIFGELVNNKVIQKATYAKMARGEMVRYMAQNNITTLEDIKGFNSLNFTFNKVLSDKETYVFIRTPDK